MAGDRRWALRTAGGRLVDAVLHAAAALLAGEIRVGDPVEVE